MDQKRAMSSVDIRALATELRDYEGAKVDKAYLYDDDLLRLKMRDFDRGRVELIIEVGDPKRAHVADPDNVPDAPGRPPNFAMMLRNRLSGADLVDVRQYEFDRILVFEFAREDANTLVLAELFGDGNIVVMNKDREVIDCLDTVRLKSRTVAPGSVYGFPSSRFNPMTCSREAFDAKMRDSDTDVVRTLATQHNLGGLWAEEICTRAGVDKELDIDDADDETLAEVFGALERLRESIRNGQFDPRVYWESDDDGERTRPVDVTPVPMDEHEGMDCDSYDRFTGALDEYFFELDREEPTPGSSRPEFEEEIAKFERIIEQQKGAIEGFEREANEVRERAETLYGNYDLVDEILTTVREARESGVPWEELETTFAEAAEAGNERAERVVGVNPEAGEVTVELDGTRIDLVPEDGVEKNADRLYQEAKRIEGKKEGALAAIEDTREDLEDAKQRRDEWTADDAEPDPEPERTGETDWLAKQNIPIRYDEQWYERFRWFHTSDGFLVIGGRNADQNEEIVKKYMESGDRFFHAQAHGGPVTVLKATGPSEPSKDIDLPQSSKEEAARFAVTNSSVWKDGKFDGDVYMVEPSQVSKTPESGEYLEKGGFTIRGDRTYFESTSVDCAVGIQCEPETRVLGGPERAIEDDVETYVTLEPGQYAQNDIAKLLYREFKGRFADESFLRKVASPDRIQEFCPPGGSRIRE
ncbi:ribosome rescue protein RqcH [Halosegnis longus]|uniref:Archaeal Rqc2 homolog aRqcH n=1 Tax=Halosegnis longus TaxID=2216012 RepID=A0AAJ4R8H8_9EURY|nr:ribosome rescue protein RqcH [Halosegnis longus]RNJ26239.1 fibronectin-binding domain-containing protein [Salella cibi]